MIHTSYGKFIYGYILLLLFFLIFDISKCDNKIISEPDDKYGDISGDSSGFILKFDFTLFDGLHEDIISPIQKKLDENYPRVCKDLELKDSFVTKIKIWNDENNFLDAMERDIGHRYHGATGYVLYNEIRILNRNYLPQTVMHEFCHIASMHVNRTIPNNPRWLWEAVAIYESSEFTDPKTLPYMVSGNYPGINDLSSDFNLTDNKIYQVGYILMEYIIKDWGMSSMVSLIKSNGNFGTSLGIPASEFQKRWHTYIKEKYFPKI